MDIGSTVLAGGKGLCLGHEKALEIVGNKSLIQWVVFSLSFFKSDIIIVTAARQLFPQFVGYPELRIVIDTCSGKGPTGNMVEPLHAVYSKGCLAPIECLLKQGNLKMQELFTLVKVRYVEATEINEFDPEHLSFFNVNTEADLETAREIMEHCL